MVLDIRSNTKHWSAMLGGIVVGLICVLAVSVAVTTAGGNSAPEREIIYAQAIDRRPSDNAIDWTTHADHVVVATATKVREVAPTRSELDVGEGLIGRRLTMRTDEVVWSRNRAARSAPSVWHWNTFGWQFKNGEESNRIDIILRNRPRVEVGHTYIIAIEWEAHGCKPTNGRWLGLGEGSILAYDGHLIGVGEVEGNEVSVREVRRHSPDGEAAALEDRVRGRRLQALRSRLDFVAGMNPSRVSQAPNCK